MSSRLQRAPNGHYVIDTQTTVFTDKGDPYQEVKRFDLTQHVVDIISGKTTALPPPPKIEPLIDSSAWVLRRKINEVIERLNTWGKS